MEPLEHHDSNDWPQPDDTLVPTNPGMHSGHLDCYDRSLSRMAHCYEAAAKVLHDAITADTARPDSLVIPLVFMRRHALELTLKELIADARELNGDTQGYPLTHDLCDLWKCTLDLLKKWHGADTPDEVDKVSKMIQEFSEVDLQSMAFRYPYDKNDRKMLATVDRINVQTFSVAMDRVQNLIRDLGFEVNRCVEYARDREAS